MAPQAPQADKAAPTDDAANAFRGPQKPKYTIVVLGPTGAGKSNLVEMFAKGTFTPHSSPSDRVEVTQVTDFLVTTDTWNADTCLVDLEIHAHMPGGANWSKDRDEALKMADGVVLVFSATDRRSFQELEKYKIAITQLRLQEHLAVTLAGNLMDAKEEDVQVKMGEAINWGRSWGPIWGVEYAQTNAKDGHNVSQPFTTVVAEIRRKSYMSDMKEATEGICTSLHQPQQEVKGKQKRSWFGKRKNKTGQAK